MDVFSQRNLFKMIGIFRNFCISVVCHLSPVIANGVIALSFLEEKYSLKGYTELLDFAGDRQGIERFLGLCSVSLLPQFVIFSKIDTTVINVGSDSFWAFDDTDSMALLTGVSISSSTKFNSVCRRSDML